VELVRRAYAYTRATRQVYAERFAPNFVWDMSNFQGWPEQQRYEGVLGAQTFVDDWTGAWENWELEIEEIHDAGDKVVVIVHQSGRARTTGMAVDMVFAQTWTIREGQFTRMDMFSDPSEAFMAAGVEERSTSANLADPTLDRGRGDNPQ
jgi:ketosteroid isomerase-like protein